MKLSPFFITVLILGACSPNSGDMRGLALAGTGASSGSSPSGTAGAGTQGPAGTGASGTVSGVSGQGASGTGTGVAGAPVSAAAGMGAAGSQAGAAGRPAAAGSGAVAGMSGTAGAAGMSAAGSGAAGSTGGPSRGTVTVEFTTVSYGGEYAPLNYGAVWFEDASGKFIKTAKRWAGAAHATDLVTWTKASGGWGSLFGGGGNTADMMDAVSSATIRTHQMHTVTWNMQDAMKQVVPDGEYVCRIEMSESRARDRMGPVIAIKFTKGAMPQMVEGPSDMAFKSVTLKYMP